MIQFIIVEIKMIHLIVELLDHHLQLALERFKNLPSEEGIDSDSIKIILENQFKKSNIKIDEKVKNTLLTTLQENLGNRAHLTQKIFRYIKYFPMKHQRDYSR